MKIYDFEDINYLILEKQNLLNKKSNNILEIVNNLCGLHATGTLEPYLQLFVRMNQFYKKDLDRELYKIKTLGRVRGMRKTLFILTIEQIPIVYNATKYLWQKNLDKYLENLQLSKEEYKKIKIKILQLVNNKEITTNDIKISLNAQIPISQIINLMCDEYILIRGPPIKSWRDRRLYYANFNNHFPNLDLNIYNEQDSLNHLIVKYIDSYGPVSLDDIAWWSGIGKNKIIPVISSLYNKIERIKISHLTYEYFISIKDEIKLKEFNNNKNRNQIINFLPLLDPYMMGYKIRERYISSKDYNYVYDRAGNATSTILLNGNVIGVWEFNENFNYPLKYYLFEDINSKLLNLIHKQGGEIGKFLNGTEVKMRKCNFMEKLTERNAGGFMSPLQNQ
ncbi:MAG: winged helix DNA-binding domain-containing protein [Candidatus Lokiarchaeota archaeon]|nr:winged helix DNA-binding domain-containing protein [Candidatus Lokiarchaeota archaeon]